MTITPTPTPDPFALDTLIAWLEQQPKAGVYDYCDNHRCVLAQYFTAQGFERVNAGPRFFYYLSKDPLDLEFKNLPCGWESISRGSNCRWTFGAALDRAKALAAKAKDGGP